MLSTVLHTLPAFILKKGPTPFLSQGLCLKLMDLCKWPDSIFFSFIMLTAESSGSQLNRRNVGHQCSTTFTLQRAFFSFSFLKSALWLVPYATDLTPSLRGLHTMIDASGAFTKTRWLHWQVRQKRVEGSSFPINKNKNNRIDYFFICSMKIITNGDLRPATVRHLRKKNAMHTHIPYRFPYGLWTMLWSTICHHDNYMYFWNNLHYLKQKRTTKLTTSTQSSLSILHL